MKLNKIQKDEDSNEDESILVQKIIEINDSLLLIYNDVEYQEYKNIPKFVEIVMDRFNHILKYKRKHSVTMNLIKDLYSAIEKLRNYIIKNGKIKKMIK